MAREAGKTGRKGSRKQEKERRRFYTSWGYNFFLVSSFEVFSKWGDLIFYFEHVFLWILQEPSKRDPSESENHEMDVASMAKSLKVTIKRYIPSTPHFCGGIHLLCLYIYYDILTIKIMMVLCVDIHSHVSWQYVLVVRNVTCISFAGKDQKIGEAEIDGQYWSRSIHCIIRKKDFEKEIRPFLEIELSFSINILCKTSH